jgi:hypothetical protein
MRLGIEAVAAGPKKKYYLGLDLGQASDYTALAVLEKQAGAARTAELHCRHLQRWPLRTPYPSIVDDVRKMLDSPRLKEAGRPVLVVDATGVGAPVVDLFRRGGINASLRPVQITGGDSVTEGEGGLKRVPKRDLVSTAQVALQTGRLKIAPGLPEAANLANEMQNFKVKISLETAHDSYGAWREGSHDDLVLAVCLALWAIENDSPGVFFSW